MDKQQKEALMDALLIHMNDDVESMGHPLKSVHFDFTEQGEDTTTFLNQHSTLGFDELSCVLNICISRGYVKSVAIGGGRYKYLGLTEEGQGRAISVEARKHAEPIPQQAGNIHIGTLNAHGPTQVGNYNTQTIENVFTAIIEQIDQADAPEADKQEAKSRLKAFLEHPLTNTAIGLSPAIIQAICGSG